MNKTPPPLTAADVRNRLATLKWWLLRLPSGEWHLVQPSTQRIEPVPADLIAALQAMGHVSERGTLTHAGAAAAAPPTGGLE